jgi:chromosome segregation protein
MRLTDQENLADSGIDIVCSPPGKRLQNVLLLSGGEKALSAVALLMAIFKYSPSPFCVMDEVDAPLDEAAQALYGVTMQEPGVSRLVSVRFNGVNEAAA